MTEYVDVSTIEVPDKVKVDYLVGDTWYGLKGWHEVRGDTGGDLWAGVFPLRHLDGTVSPYTRIRAHRPALVPVPTESGIAFVATVRGVPDVPTLVTDLDDGDLWYVTARLIGGPSGTRWHRAEHITDVRQVTRLGVEVDR